MSSLNYNFEKITQDSGNIIGIKVKRPTYSVYYHRTGRGASDVFDSPQGELHSMFHSKEEFVSSLKRKSILDLGCGNGNLVNDLNRAGLNISGLDLYLDPSQKKSSFSEGDAYQLNRTRTKYDLVLALWSVFHYEPLAQLRALFQSVLQSVKPKGSIVIPEMNDMKRLRQIKAICEKENIQAGFDTKSKLLVVFKK